MTNTIMGNLSMFRNLRCDDAFANVIIVTTFWDEMLDAAKGDMREKTLMQRADWWGYMVKKGSRTWRFLNTRESALSILADAAGLPAVTLQIQEEIVEQGREIADTTVGEALDKELAETKRTYQRELASLQAENEQAARDHDEELRRFLDEAEREKHDLIRQLESEQAALRADRREEQRRMEQRFKDQIARLRRDRERGERSIEDLEARLTTERADAERRFAAAMDQSDRIIGELRAEMLTVAEDERRRYGEAIDRVRLQQKAAADESAKWKAEVERLGRQVSEAVVAQRNAAGTEERRRLEQRILFL